MPTFVLCFSLFLCCVLSSVQQDANTCGNYPTCEECIAHNPCGWCSVPVVYSDGTLGPRCAGKPKNISNPPPGYKPWTCPVDFQNDKCFGYVCNDLFQCVSSGAPGAGVPLQECLSKCFPPTYECNTTTYQCEKVEPGHGTDLPNCQSQCNPSTTSSTTTGDTTTGESTSGGPDSTPTPEASYTCDTTSFTCVESGSGGIPKSDCDEICGKPTNNTPPFALGDYRGLQISKGYITGEWEAKIDQNGAVIIDPSKTVWAKGSVKVKNNELWLITSDGAVNRGLYGISDLAQVEVLTWAFGSSAGASGRNAPNSFDDAMMGGTVFVLAKCLNPNVCQFNVLQNFARNILRQRLVAKNFDKRNTHVVVDECSKYPDCTSCINAREQCGWCSVNVIYNSSYEGKNCAGLNKTIAPSINCTGSFSTEDCTFSSPTPTDAPTTGQTTGNPNDKYKCDPVNYTCVLSESGDGIDQQNCEAQCVNVPGVPPNIQNQVFRGLQINRNYREGEWRAEFDDTSVTITDPSGSKYVGKVSTVSQYLTITLQSGDTIQTLWQLGQGAASQFLSWAWGPIGGAPPKSFESAMIDNGNSEYWFVSCLPGKDKSLCDFSN